MKWSVWRGLCLLLLFCSLGVCPARGQTQEMENLLEHARSAQSAGQYREAAELYARATGLSPATPELWSNRGVMEYLGGEKDASIRSLTRALELKPDLFVPMLFLGKAYVDSGKPAAAVAVLNRAHRLRADDVEVLLTLGKANAALDRPRAAATFYAKAAALSPRQPSAWFGLGVSSLRVIEADGREMAATQPQSIWSRSLYADDLFAQSRPIEAAATYRASLAKATPAQKAVLLQMLRWMNVHAEVLALPVASQEAVEKLTSEAGAREEVSAGPRCGAAEGTAQGEGKPAMSLDAALHGAACAYLAGEPQRSAEQAAQAIDASPGNPEALYWSVKANERVAVTALAQFEELSADSAAKFVLVGNLYRLQRQPEKALAEYRKALALDGHDPAALLGAVLACVSANRLEEATALDATALVDQPKDPQFNLLMAEILDAQGEHGKEEPYLAKASTAPPALQPRVHYLLGRVYAENGRTEDAIHQYELALPGDTDGSMHYQLSRLYRKSGDAAKAEAVLAKAKSLIGQRDATAFTVVREAASPNP